MGGVTDFGRCASGFLTTYLQGERGASPKTVQSYGRTIRSLIIYLGADCKIKAESIALSDITAERVRGFLQAMETSGLSASTCNQRLCAIKSFVRYAVREEPAFMCEGQRILAIASKKSISQEVEYLEQDALSAMLASPDLATVAGRRDVAIMSMLYDSAARIQELIDIEVGDVRLDAPSCVRLHGKGDKMRAVPIMESTATHIRRYLQDRHLPQDNSRLGLRLFCSTGRSSYTRPGIAKILMRHFDRARQQNPNIRFPKSIHPHMLRASKAIHLLDAGVNIIAIRDFLGHVSINTTQRYLRVNTKSKMEAIVASAPVIEVAAPLGWRQDSDLMAFLNHICS